MRTFDKFPAYKQLFIVVPPASARQCLQSEVRPRGSSDIPLLNLRLLRSAVLLPQGKSLLFRIG